MVSAEQPIGLPTTTPEIQGATMETMLNQQFGTAGDIGPSGIPFQTMQQHNELAARILLPIPIQVQKVPIPERDPFPGTGRGIHPPENPGIDGGQVAVSKEQGWVVGGGDQWHFGFFMRFIPWGNGPKGRTVP